MAKSLPRLSILIAATLLAAGTLYDPGPGVMAEERPTASDTSEVEEAEVMPAADGVVVIYRGTLQDEAGGPVSGVFPLEFKLYRGSMSAEPIWSEEHFVSVVDGRYQVPLGHQTALREHLLVGERWIGVELESDRELLRDRITVQRPDSGNADEERPSGQQVSYADVAEHATEAELARLAENALALDGMTAQEIEDMANLALRRLGEHIADPDAHSAVTGPSLGSRGRAVGDTAGGGGGSPYDVRCPEGQVVTGITGNAGRVVDNITVICTPLQ